jgi:uncharacterized membrane protein
MDQQKSLYQNGTMNSHMLLIPIGLAMIAASIYLTNHYFGLKFPTGLEGASACNFNDFFSCDKTTNSIASNIFGVPISVFGILVGVLIFAGYVFKNELVEGTTYFVLTINLIGCAVLFLFSLFVIKSLCPVCSLYYLLSGAAWLVFKRGSSYKSPNLKVLGIYAVLAFIFAGSSYAMVNKKQTALDSISEDLLKQYWNLPKLGQPEPQSPFRIATSTENFTDAAIQLTLFSDFQCPACKVLSDMTHEIAEKYKGNINIQYMFYPLDMNCNLTMKRALHPQACKAAYLASCLPKKFAKVHDDIFNNQSDLSDDWVNNYAKEEGVTECMNDPKTKEKVIAILNQAKPYGVRSTPTMLVNGVKIEGALPPKQLFVILDDILKKSGK